MNQSVPLPLVRARGLRAVPPHLEAAGAVAGHVEDLTSTLPSVVDTLGRRWAQYLGVWLLTHKIVSGDTLWKLTKTYYGSAGQSVANVQIIGNHPLNAAILVPSSNYTKAIPGDVIVIPNLTPPADVVASRGQPLPSIDNPSPAPIPVVNADPNTITVTDPSKPGLSTGVKVAIGSAALAFAAAVAYFFMRQKKRKNPRRRR